MLTSLSYILVGLIAGTAGGAFGIGGGVIMIPAFVMFFGLTQHQAQGTAVAVMLPPILILAVMRYYQAGNVKVKMACFVALGFIFGAYLGAHLVQYIPDGTLKKIFGILMILVGVKMVFCK